MENSKTVLVVGNGFDLAIGRKTSYWDFYESEYCPKRYPAPIIAYLNQKLTDNHNVRWLDLETALQNYAVEANNMGNANDYFFSEDQKMVIAYYKNTSCEPLIENYRSIVTGVENFEEVENELLQLGVLYTDNWGLTKVPYDLDFEILNITNKQFDKKALGYIEDGLSSYLNNLKFEHQKNVCYADTIMKNALNKSNAKVYSFNYTDICKLYAEDENQIEKYNTKIHYVHGSLKDNNIIIGAKDGDYGNYDFVQKAFSPHYGSTPIVKDLLEADDVHIYGHSLGDCDSQYFAPFFLQQVQPNANRKSITIYTYDEKSMEEIKKNIQKLTGNKLSNLYSMNDFKILTQKEMDVLYENIKKSAMAKRV